MGRFSVPNYRDIPGLGKFPPERRFIVYRTVHRELLDGDPAYRRACLRYALFVVGLCLATVVLQILQTLEVVSSTAMTVAGIASMVLVIAAAFRAQRYRDLRIDRDLQKQENCKV